MSKSKAKTTKEQEYVSSVLPTYGDSELLFISWVKKINPKGKVQKRLLALSEHHIFSFKFTSLGKKALQRYGHYFDLKELVSTDKQQLDIQFQDFNIKFTSDNVPKIIKAIREIYVSLHPYHPEQELSLALKINDKKILLELDKPKEARSSFTTFWKVFTTWNSYLNGSDPGYLKEEIEELFSDNNEGMELHNPTLRDHIHFKALCKTLLFCDRLTRLSLVKYSIGNDSANKEENNNNKKGEDSEEKKVEALDDKRVWQLLETSLVELLSHSYGLRHLVLSGLPLSYNFFKSLDDSVKRKRAANSSTTTPRVDTINKNEKEKEKEKEKGKGKGKEKKDQKEEKEKETTPRSFFPVEILDFSDTKIEERSGALLADTLKILSKTLAHVNLSGTGIQPETLHLICEALLFCTGVSLKHLDFSKCTFDKDSTSSLSPVLTAGTCLQYLGLKECKGLDIAELCRALKNKGCGLAHLNISENEIDENDGEKLASLIAGSSSLRNVDISSTSLTLPTLSLVLKAVGANKELPATFVLNASENPDIGKKKELLQDLLVKPLLMRRTKLHTLNLDGAGLGDDGMQILFFGLAESETKATIKELSVSRNLEFNKEKKEGRANTAKALRLFLSGNPALESLTIMGDGAEKSKKKSSFGFGPLLGEALSSLAENNNLQKLNIIGNDMGDEGVEPLVAALAKNSTLKTLHWDSNRISLKGYQAFLEGFEDNKTLVELAYPVKDITAIEATLGADKKTKKAKKKELTELLASINAIIKRNIALQEGSNGTVETPREEEKKKTEKEEKREEENSKKEGGKKGGSKRGKDKKGDEIEEKGKDDKKKKKKGGSKREKKLKADVVDKDEGHEKKKGGNKGVKKETKKDKEKKGKEGEGTDNENKDGKEETDSGDAKGAKAKTISGRELKGYPGVEGEDEGPKREAPTQYSAFPKLRKNSAEAN